MSILEIPPANKESRNSDARPLRKRTIMAIAQLLLAITGLLFAGTTATTAALASADNHVSSALGPCGDEPGFCP